MELLKEKQLENGDWLWDIEYSMEEYEMFKQFAVDEGQNVDNMDEGEIVQFSVVEILKKQIERDETEREQLKLLCDTYNEMNKELERMENEQNRTSETSKD